MKCALGLSQDSRSKTVELLQKLLAQQAVLYVKTLNYHWNVSGPHFDFLHAFFKKQYEQLFDIIDAVAERIRTLDEKPYASLQEYLNATSIKEDSVHESKSDQNMLAQLLQDHETIICYTREIILVIQDQYKDIGTANLLTDDVLEQQEKMAWMLRASLVAHA